ncbi:hypothetical protein PPERSA_01848 [Pseudocohnilembus persalinus]|uniref:Uncharacterized protein n=1 Tax=Pseudocohnilembus persalinus TaxID=266149 RepID=A0A0V0R253_PSEPJ|nr:hypothetical protein PPERSA_01848 [Pseudocohnilembus persalinus]|eukprot:KRX08595.1 hypothetical protein PPERSA_01848 [Pseudocohnilembus persalinus]
MQYKKEGHQSLQYQYQQQKQQKKKQQLKLYKSDFNTNSNKGKFEVDNDARTIKFKTIGYDTCIYSENLQREKEYHLRFKVDTKNNLQNIHLAFSITSGDKKNSKSLLKDHYVCLFNRNYDSCAEGGEFQVKGLQYYLFFKDKKTVMNVVFNIEKQMMEIYDDDRICYQKLTFDKDRKFDEWILGIYYYQWSGCYSEVDIQFID